MKRFIYAVILTCLGAILIGLNTKEHNPPVQEVPQTHVEAPQATPIPEPIQEPIPVVETIVEPVKAPEPAYDGVCGDNALAHEIYRQESGCILDRVNSIGACGLGQALPCSKLSSVCPNWQTDYACQNQFFTGYAMSYGGWTEAHAFKYCLWTCYSTRTKTTVNKHGEAWW